MAGRSVTSKVLALLQAFTPQAPELTLSELARRAGVSMPTAHRRARELVTWGALERGPDGRFHIGLRLWEVASLAPRGLGLREAALPFLEDLYEVSHENVQLAVREGLEVVFVERIASRRAVPVLTRVGGRFALHATGVGLVLLAHAPVRVQEELLAAPLHGFSPRTITDPVRLRAVLADVRRAGYAVSDGQVTVDALSVAAPILGPRGQRRRRGLPRRACRVRSAGGPGATGHGGRARDQPLAGRTGAPARVTTRSAHGDEDGGVSGWDGEVGAADGGFGGEGFDPEGR